LGRKEEEEANMKGLIIAQLASGEKAARPNGCGGFLELNIVTLGSDL
jgi:hypothetical protein